MGSKTQRGAEGEGSMESALIGLGCQRESGEGGEEASRLLRRGQTVCHLSCLSHGFRLLAVQCYHASSGKVAAQPNSLHKWCL